MDETEFLLRGKSGKVLLRAVNESLRKEIKDLKYQLTIYYQIVRDKDNEIAELERKLGG